MPPDQNKFQMATKDFQPAGTCASQSTPTSTLFSPPIRDYMSIAFQNGFVLDGFEERAFPPEHPQTSTLGWGWRFSELPPVLMARMRLQ